MSTVKSPETLNVSPLNVTVAVPGLTVCTCTRNVCPEKVFPLICDTALFDPVAGYGPDPSDTTATPIVFVKRDGS
jgi:hypothetical protein